MCPPGYVDSKCRVKINCKYWDEVRQSWSADGVNTTLSADGTRVACLTSHLTTFGGIIDIPTSAEELLAELKMAFTFQTFTMDEAFALLSSFNLGDNPTMVSVIIILIACDLITLPILGVYRGRRARMRRFRENSAYEEEQVAFELRQLERQMRRIRSERHTVKRVDERTPADGQSTTGVNRLHAGTCALSSSVPWTAHRSHTALENLDVGAGRCTNQEAEASAVIVTEELSAAAQKLQAHIRRRQAQASVQVGRASFAEAQLMARAATKLQAVILRKKAQQHYRQQLRECQSVTRLQARWRTKAAAAKVSAHHANQVSGDEMTSNQRRQTSTVREAKHSSSESLVSLSNTPPPTSPPMSPPASPEPLSPEPSCMVSGARRRAKTLAMLADLKTARKELAAARKADGASSQLESAAARLNKFVRAKQAAARWSREAMGRLVETARSEHTVINLVWTPDDPDSLTPPQVLQIFWTTLAVELVVICFQYNGPLGEATGEGGGGRRGGAAAGSVVAAGGELGLDTFAIQPVTALTQGVIASGICIGGASVCAYIFRWANNRQRRTDPRSGWVYRSQQMLRATRRRYRRCQRRWLRFWHRRTARVASYEQEDRWSRERVHLDEQEDKWSRGRVASDEQEAMETWPPQIKPPPGFKCVVRRRLSALGWLWLLLMPPIGCLALCLCMENRRILVPIEGEEYPGVFPDDDDGEDDEGAASELANPPSAPSPPPLPPLSPPSASAVAFLVPAVEQPPIPSQPAACFVQSRLPIMQRSPGETRASGATPAKTTLPPPDDTKPAPKVRWADGNDRRPSARFRPQPKPNHAHEKLSASLAAVAIEARLNEKIASIGWRGEREYYTRLVLAWLAVFAIFFTSLFIALIYAIKFGEITIKTALITWAIAYGW